jgi:hypothetical protein
VQQPARGPPRRRQGRGRVQPELDGVLGTKPPQDIRWRVNRRGGHRPHPAIRDCRFQQLTIEPLRAPTCVAYLDAFGGDPLDHVMVDSLDHLVPLISRVPRPQPRTCLQRWRGRGRARRQRRVLPGCPQVEHRPRTGRSAMISARTGRQPVALVSSVQIVALEVRRDHPYPLDRRVRRQRVSQPAQAGRLERMDAGDVARRARSRGWVLAIHARRVVEVALATDRGPARAARRSPPPPPPISSERPARFPSRQRSPPRRRPWPPHGPARPGGGGGRIEQRRCQE